MNKLLQLSTVIILVLALSFFLNSQDKSIKNIKQEIGMFHFEKGKPARASEVNKNFSVLLEEINNLKSQIAHLKRTSGKSGGSTPSLPPLPIGSIIASMVPPKSMESISKGTWVLADGRSGTSAYRNAVKKNNLPDLRGRFLRGLKNGDGRYAGHYQKDQLARHRHKGYHPKWVSFNKGLAVKTTGSDSYWGIHDTLTSYSGGGNETYPKNVAVYYYIKVQ